MGAKLAKEETIALEKAIRDGKVKGHTKGTCRSCSGPVKEMRFRGRPLTHCRCGYAWA